MLKLSTKNIKSKKSIINEFKLDLWGDVLLLNSLKFKNLYNKLYFNKKKRFQYHKKIRYLTRFIFLKNNKLFYKFHKFIKKNKKSLTKFHYFNNLNLLKQKNNPEIINLKALTFKKFYQNLSKINNNLFYKKQIVKFRKKNNNYSSFEKSKFKFFLRYKINLINQFRLKKKKKIKKDFQIILN